MGNAMNDDEKVETDNGTDDLDEIERSFPSLKVYDDVVGGSISLEKF
jgi:hypothetical protein